MIDDVLRDSEDRMKKSIEAVDRELAAIRTGHAHVGLVDHIKVDYFGTSLPVNQMATVQAPEARLLTIQPWDRSALTAIEKALAMSDLGLNPSNDGQTIRLAIPPLTEQRRKELIKLVHTRVEDGRVAVRNVRRDGNEHIKRLVQSKDASEDDQRKGQEQLQKLTDRYVAIIDQRGKDKEAELLEV
ncbi:MAG TPA: ribosome recycling factor [Dehalococcoidia bacterium]|jgi:ribosome recycling factor|nr:ribosome recycling factor [Dehalococcoidia bacterium]